MIAPIDPNVSATPWCNRFVFSLVSSVSHPLQKYVLAKRWREWKANTLPRPNVTRESPADQLVTKRSAAMTIDVKQTTRRVLAALVAGSLVSIQPTTIRAEDGSQLVDDFHAAFGKHHARANHAKGVILEGSFVPTDDASALSKAAVFARPSVAVTIRFSDFGGIPDIPDNIGEANPHGLAIKFRSSSDADLDVVTHSFNGFPTATADGLGMLLRAIGSSGPGVAKPTALDKFLGSHPIAKTFLTTQNPPPASYATTAYFGVNSVAFVDAKNERHSLRYRFVPEAGEHYLDEATRKSKGPNYLSEEIAKRVAATPIRFDWYAQLAESGDKVEDPSIAWPETRTLVKLGMISVERIAPDQTTAAKSLLFMPGTFPNGIEAADPMFAVRNAAYPISFGERQ
jgi:catalase